MQPIQRVAIVGAGNMGSGIAQKSAQEEFDVQMVDREQQCCLLYTSPSPRD